MLWKNRIGFNLFWGRRNIQFTGLYLRCLKIEKEKNGVDCGKSVRKKDGSCNGFMDLVCNDENDGDFIMGCACATSNNSKEEYNYLKEMSYADISNDNKIWNSCLVIR